MKRGKFETKRFFGLLLAIVMVFSLVPQGVLAGEGIDVDPSTIVDGAKQEIEAAQQSGSAFAPAGNPVTNYEVKFYDWDDSVLLNTSVEAGAAAVAPTSPGRDGYEFKGWYLDKNGTTSATSAMANVSGNLEIWAVYNKLPDIFTLTIEYFYTAEITGDIAGGPAADTYVATLPTGSAYSVASPTVTGFNPSPATVSGKLTENTTIQVTYTPSGETGYKVKHIFEGLNGANSAVEEDSLSGTTGNATIATAMTRTGFEAQPFEQATIAADGSTVVEINYLRTSNYVRFHTNGGTWVDTVEAKYGETVSLPTTTEKLGHVFDGWYTDENFTSGTKVTSVPMGTADVDLYAKWKTGTANYTVVFWLEQVDKAAASYPGYVNGDGYAYDYKEFLTQNGNVGNSISASNYGKNYSGFTYAGADTPTITADGQTIQNVYFNRNTYTVKFHLDEGIIFTNWKHKETITARYGENVRSRWDEIATKLGSDYLWYIGTSSKTFYMSLEDMPAYNINVYGKKNGSTKHELYYMLENLAGNGYDAKPGTPVKFTAGKDSYITEKEDCYPIDGFTYEKYTDFSGSNPREAYIYYKRATFNVDLNDNYPGTTTRNYLSKVKYEAPISAPANPVREGYTFEGWYDNAACAGVPYTFSTMPSNNLVLYAKWTPLVFDVDFDLNYDGATGAPATQEDIPLYGTVAEPADPTRDHYTFEGWYLDAECTGTRYIFDKPVTSDFTLYAKWAVNPYSDYTVTYTIEGGGEYAPTKTESNVKVGSTVTEYAVIDPAKPKYAPTAASMSKVIEANAANNVFEFIYKEFDVLPYAVYYVDGDGKDLAAPKIVMDNEAVQVTENYEFVEGYTPNRYQIKQTLVVEDDIVMNKIVFTYTPNKAGEYYVRHMLQNLTGDGYELDTVAGTEGPFNAPVGSTPDVSDKAKTYAGFTYKEQKGSQVTSDGKTVYTLYYDRDLFDVNFVVSSEADKGHGTLSGTTAFEDIRYDTPWGSAISAVPTATPSGTGGYVFTGWWDGTTSLGVSPDWTTLYPTITADKTFVATFEKDASKWYEVTYDKNNENATGTMAPDTNIEHGSSYTVKANEFALTGWEFVGWNTNGTDPASGTWYDANDKINPITGDVTLFAIWRSDAELTIEYRPNTGGNYYEGSTVDNTKYNTFDDVTVLANRFTYPGYTFTGWNTAANGSGTSYAELQEFKIQSSLTLYAQWAKDDAQWATVAYDGNGSTNGTAPATVDVVVISGIAYVPGTSTQYAAADKGSLARDHYDFTGWNTVAGGSGTAIDVGGTGIPATGGETTTLYAQWAEHAQYDVIYNPNGGVGSNYTDPAGKFYKDTNATVLGNDTVGFTRDQAIFLGWSTTQVALVETESDEAAALTGAFQKGGSIAIINVDRILYAIWAADGNKDDIPDYKQFTVSYDLNDTTGVGQATGPVPASVIYNKANNNGVLLPNGKVDVSIDDATGFADTRTGYEFIGWNTEANGSGTAIDADTGTFGYYGNVDLTLYAQWKPLVYTITYTGIGDATFNGSAANPNPATYTIESDTITIVDPAREGYDYSGWDGDPVQYSGANVSIPAGSTGNIALEATWEPIMLNVRFQDHDGSLIREQQVQYGRRATAPANPNRVGYTFTGWDTNEYMEVKRDLVVTAQYAPIYFTVTFVDYDGTVIDSQQVQYGNGATAPADPTRDGWMFTGWDTDTYLANVTDDITVTAQYAPIATPGYGMVATGYTGAYDAAAHSVDAYLTDLAGNRISDAEIRYQTLNAAGNAVGTASTVAPSATNVNQSIPRILATAYVDGNAVFAREISLNITPLAATVTAPTVEKEEGEADPSIGASITRGSNLARRQFTYYSYREEGEDPGDYTIYVGVNANSNVRVTRVPGTLTINGEDAPDEIIIPDDDVPTDDGTPDDTGDGDDNAAAPVVDIDDNETPTDPGQKHWALWNLILTIVTGVIMLVILIGYFVGKKRKEEEDNPYQRQANTNEQESEEELKRRGIIRLLTIIPTIIAVIVFILTEDMRLPMQMTDEWTIWMAVIAIVQVVVAVFTKKKRVTPEDDEMDKAAPQNF